jgi:hypothetical protein
MGLLSIRQIIEANDLWLEEGLDEHAPYRHMKFGFYVMCSEGWYEILTALELPWSKQCGHPNYEGTFVFVPCGPTDQHTIAVLGMYREVEDE